MIADTETWTANFRCGGCVCVGMVVVVGREVGGGVQSTPVNELWNVTRFMNVCGSTFPDAESQNHVALDQHSLAWRHWLLLGDGLSTQAAGRLPALAARGWRGGAARGEGWGLGKVEWIQVCGRGWGSQARLTSLAPLLVPTTLVLHLWPCLCLPVSPVALRRRLTVDEQATRQLHSFRRVARITAHCTWYTLVSRHRLGAR